MEYEGTIKIQEEGADDSKSSKGAYQQFYNNIVGGAAKQVTQTNKKRDLFIMDNEEQPDLEDTQQINNFELSGGMQ